MAGEHTAGNVAATQSPAESTPSPGSDVRRQAIQEAQDDSQAFLRIVAHDLKTPLTNILGYAQLGQRLSQRLAAASDEAHGDAAARLHTGLERIIDNCKRLQRLVDNLQEGFRLGSGRFDLHCGPVDVGALVQSVVEEQQQSASTHRISTALPPVAIIGMWDRDRLRQLCTHLLSNAVKYSPAGGPIKVEVWREEDSAVFCVTDQGLGIPPADLPSVFQPYSKLHQSRATKGAGFGLYVAKGIVDAHGGAISADSPGENQGATFAVRLPISRPS